MNEALADFPNRKIYGGTLRNGPGSIAKLDEKMPGIADTLKAILARGWLPGGETSNAAVLANFDAHLRLHYLEVDGTRKKHEYTGSMIVPEHVELFFAAVFPLLQAFFLRNKAKVGSMHDNVMIICAYSYAVCPSSSHE